MQKGKAAPQRPLRVALTITELNVGGAEQSLTNLALGLNRERFEPVVISLGPPPVGDRAKLVEQLEAVKTPVHFLHLRSSGQALPGLIRLQRLYRQLQPDVVQSFLYHANVLSAIAARRVGVKAIATGVRVADPRRTRLIVERFASHHVSRIVCVSQAVAEFVARQGGFPASKIVVIPNGIDLGPFTTSPPVDLRALGVPPGRRAVVVVARLDAQKGIDWLLSMAPELLAQAPHHDLLLVGEGPQRRELEHAAKEGPFADRIHFAGFRSDIPSILAACDLLLLPSRWEGMPNAVLETMAAQRPVVATRSEGVVELLGDDADAQLVTFGEAQDFIKKALTFLCDQRAAQIWGQRNRQRVEQRFSLATMVGRYERLFEEIGASGW